MANYETLKAAIQDVVKTNGNNEITGALLQQSLLAMINSLGAGYQYMGVAVLTPTPTVPGTPDQKVFYIANGKGTYANFGGLSVTEDEVVFLCYDTAWHKLLTGIASQEKLSELDVQINGEKVGNIFCTEPSINQYIKYLHINDKSAAQADGLYIWQLNVYNNVVTLFWKRADGSSFHTSIVQETLHGFGTEYGGIVVDLNSKPSSSIIGTLTDNIGEDTYKTETQGLEGRVNNIDEEILNLENKLTITNDEDLLSNAIEYSLYYVDTTLQKWVWNSDVASAYIDIKNKDVNKINVLAGNTVCSLHFVKKHIMPSYPAEKFDICTPFKINIPANSTQSIEVPSDCEAIYILYKFGGTDRKPTAVRNISSHDAIESLQSQIDNIKNSGYWHGKKLLAIGDSITVGGQWARKVAQLLGMTYRVHAKGGIGIVNMVDGGDAPEGYDPSTGADGELYKLNAKDVEDIDVVILMGFYNARNLASSGKGNEGDLYPAQNTFFGQLNYAVKRVYEELAKANNMTCKVVICSAHKYGSYQFLTQTSYEDGEELFAATKAVADYHSLHLIDLMHNGGINKFNWNIYQSASSRFNPAYITADGSANDGTNKPFASLDNAPSASGNTNKIITIQGVSGCYISNGSVWQKDTDKYGYILPYPQYNDQLHMNELGYEKIGGIIAGELNKIIS